MGVTGTHFVRPLRSAFQKARKLWPAAGPRMEVRRQALKLRFWGQRHEAGTDASILDLSYESIKAMPGSGVYELRLDDEIGGHRNIRIVFFVPPSEWKCLHDLPLPALFVLEPVVKKRNEWTAGDLARFRAGRAVVKERFYET